MHTENVVNETGIIYSIAEDDVSICATVGKKHRNPLISRMDNCTNESYSPNILYMNRGIRYENTFLFTGNLPAFGMGKVRRDINGLMPPIVGLGFLHFKIKVNEFSYSFEEADHINVRHMPNGTKWSVKFDAIPDTEFVIYASLIDEGGIAATVSVKAYMPLVSASLECALEGGKIADHSPSYFSEHARKIDVNVTTAKSSAGSITIYTQSDDAEYYSKSEYILLSKSDITVNSNTVYTTQISDIGEILAIAGTHAPFNGIAINSCQTFEDVDDSIVNSERRLRYLLNRTQLKTSSVVMNAGIHNAVLNMDYMHVDKAWLEGGQWWNVYWTNNFQISAAVAMGQYTLARKALLFFGSRKDGYSPISMTCDSCERWTKEDGKYAIGFDGIPYYLHALWQYTCQTGDLSVVREIAENVHKMCFELLDICDTDSDCLLSWKYGTNSFIYQADHLALPGAAASPSLMMAGSFNKFSELLSKVGLTKLSIFYSHKAEQIYMALPKLWSDEGYFLSAIDILGSPCKAHYYTDLVFPFLYTDLAPEIKYLSLAHLKEELFFRSASTNRLLMRVGELKPDMFGNNIPMPTQMAETARAFFKVGDYDTAYELLESCAFANSIYTENPGSTPEKFNNLGKGEPDYMFGNPAGSLCYAAFDGLLGVRCEDYGKTIVFEPGMPLNMPCWSFRLPYAFFHLENSMKETHSLVYTVKVDNRDNIIERLIFGICIPADTDISYLKISVNGEETKFNVFPGLNCRRVTFEHTICQYDIQIALVFASAVHFNPIPSYNKTLTVKCGDKVDLISKEHISFFGNNDFTYDTPGVYYRAYLDKEQLFYGLIRVLVKEDTKPFEKTECFEGEAIDIHEILNADSLPYMNYWRFGGENDVSFIEYENDRSGYISIPAGNVRYIGIPVCKNSHNVKVCRLIMGRSNISRGVIDKSAWPNSVSFFVNQRVSAISLLYIAEIDVRLSQNSIGKIRLCYDDNTVTTLPLTAGDNVGSVMHNYAENTYHVGLSSYPNDTANHYCIICDKERVLDRVELVIEKEDVIFGLIAANKYI